MPNDETQCRREREDGEQDGDEEQTKTRRSTREDKGREETAEEGGETAKRESENKRQQTLTFNYAMQGCVKWSKSSERK
jgi:hypothetical protein